MTPLPTAQERAADQLPALAEKNVRDLLSLALGYAPPQAALVFYKKRLPEVTKWNMLALALEEEDTCCTFALR